LVEMLVIGALASVVSAGAVLTIGEATNILNTEKLAEDFNRYLLTEPARAFGALIVFYGLAYTGAWVVAAVRHRRDGDFTPDGSAWYQAFARGCPEGSIPFLTIELKDGRWIAGAYKKATVERDDNRELCLQKPLGLAQSAESEMEPEPFDEFLLLREEEIRQIKGRYLREFPTTGAASAPVEQRPRSAF
jgi:hypothetical protein